MFVNLASITHRLASTADLLLAQVFQYIIPKPCETWGFDAEKDIVCFGGETACPMHEVE